MVKCSVCGKEYKDVPGIKAERRLRAHISAVHGKIAQEKKE